MRKNLKKKSIKHLRTLLFLMILLGFVLYLFYLDHKIQSKFEIHRWNLPSRVYSEALYLYPGLKMGKSELIRKLKRLSYKQVDGSAKNIGEYADSVFSVSVYLHDFQYPTEMFKGFPVELQFSGNTLDTILDTENGEALRILKLEPERIASIFDEKMEDRTVVTMPQISPAFINAVIAIEDERFFEHQGIDFKAILRALLTDMIHLKLEQGGSTLTQQLVKNFFLTSKKSFVRKFNELLMAPLLELHYSKKEILEAYFNEIYFGQKGPVSITGVEEAAHFYFSKKASDLTLSESATLAGLIQSPGTYSPFRSLTKALQRRDLILKTMRNQNKISERDFFLSKSEGLTLPQKQTAYLQAPYFIQFVQEELKQNYPTEILQAEGMSIFTTLDMRAQEIAEEALQTNLSELETRPKLKKLREKGKILEGAFVSLQPQTGSIRALVGGRDYENSQFNRVTQAHRQPGSAFKPFVYAVALESKNPDGNPITLATQIEDSFFTVRMGGKNWEPKNYDHKEHGLVTLRQALEQSYNLATTRLAMEVGLDRIVNLAHRAGIESNLKPYPSLALGAFEVTPLELIRAYTIFPNQGTRTKPMAIKSLISKEGKRVEQRGFEMQQVLTPEVSYLANQLMRGVLDRGTASSARTMGFKGLGAGKTGTTSDYRDSWFVGYTPDLLSLAWIGYDDGTPTGLSGSSGALKIWTEFMKNIYSLGAQDPDFKATDEIVLVQMSDSGKLYRPDCGAPREEAFIKGTEPKEYCDKN